MMFSTMRFDAVRVSTCSATAAVLARHLAQSRALLSDGRPKPGSRLQLELQ